MPFFGFVFGADLSLYPAPLGAAFFATLRAGALARAGLALERDFALLRAMSEYPLCWCADGVRVANS
jgi:hypothetical protein